MSLQPEWHMQRSSMHENRMSMDCRSLQFCQGLSNPKGLQEQH